jgi:hypothetical protein
MKKTLLAFVVLTTTVFASQAQVRFGVQAGVVSSSISLEEDGEEADIDGKMGFTVGAIVDVPISETFAFQPAVNFVTKGAKQEESGGGVTAKFSINLAYVEVPFNFVYRASTGSGSFFVGAGPSVGFIVSAKQKTKVTGGGLDEESEEDIPTGSGEDELKPLEIGANILAGYELANGVYIALNYNLGMSNLINDAPDNTHWKNRYFGLRVGFRFGGGGEASKR